MSDSGAWLSVADAATRLGVSDDTIRRRLKTGTLAGKPEPTARGFRWVVNLDGAVAAAEASAPIEPASADASTPQPAEASADAPLSDREQRLWEQLAEKDRQVAAKDQQISELHILLQRALERQTVLELPAADTVAAHTAAPPEPKQERRRWWHWIVWG